MSKNKRHTHHFRWCSLLSLHLYIGKSNKNLIEKYIELTDCMPLINVIIYKFNDEIIVFFSQNMNGVMYLQITTSMQLYDIVIKQFMHNSG
jgi:hypothetical protein